MGDDTINVSSDGTWNGYSALNVNTGDKVSLAGKTRITDVFQGGAGNDTLVGTDQSDAIFLDDSFSGFYGGQAQARLDSIENVQLGDGDDVLDMTSTNYTYTDNMTVDGGAGNDAIWTAGGDDNLSGGTGNDMFFGGGGDDAIDGGADNDTVTYTGLRSDYTITDNAGVYTIVDNRPGSPDGTDTVTGVENFQFADGTVSSALLINEAPTDIQATLSSSLGSNMIVNGSFENAAVSSNYLANFSSIEGWTPSSGLVQIHDNFGGHTASDGSQYLDIDAEMGADAVYQDIATTAGENFQLSFDAADRIGRHTNAFEVYWNGAKVADIDPASTDWSTYTFNVVGTGGADRLEFRELASGDDAYGALIDNVKLQPVYENSIAENASAGTLVASLSATDPDAGESFTYAVVGGEASNFEVVGNEILVKAGANIDFEMAQSHDISVEVTDSAGNTYSETVTINVSDVDEGNVIIDTAEAVAISGSASIDAIHGRGGDDVIDGAGGADTLYGDAGNDVIAGGEGNDWISGGAGNDSLRGDGGNDTLTGGDGSDMFIFQMGDGTDTISGGAGGGWTDTVLLQDASGGNSLGTYGVDWTVTLTEGTIDGQDANGLDLSSDADGIVTLSDGSTVNFFDVERIDF
ncbi:hemolysin, plasmid [bacterium BMS3Bbin10]|nr:hemolysin, plasmid [bacterium BMS3Bbin10]